MAKYKVTKEFMNELVEWRDKKCLDAPRGYGFVYSNDLNVIPHVVKAWWLYGNTSIERNNRLIAIVSWLNGEDVFDVEAPHKFIVRSEKPDEYEAYTYVVVSRQGVTITSGYRSNATKFDTREEAQEWANSHQVIIEVDKNGKEV